MRFIEIGLEAMRAINKFSDTFGAIERGFVVEHLLRTAPIITVWLVSSGASYAMHLPGLISNLNSARVAQAASVVRIRLAHEKLFANVRDGVVNRRELFVLHWNPLLAPIRRRHIETIFDDLRAGRRLPLDEMVVGQQSAPALHRIGGGVLSVFEARKMAGSAGCFRSPSVGVQVLDVGSGG